MNTNSAEVLPIQPTLHLVQAAQISPNKTVTFVSREIIILAFVLGVLQIADGVLTAVGVYHLGIEMEGNPILRLLMNNIGMIPTLLVSKGMALGVIVLLTTFAGAVSWLTLAMRGMVALYTLCAIIPWSAILYGYFS